MGSDQKRAILAVVLSGLVLFGWQYFFAPAPEHVLNQKVGEEKIPVTKDESQASKTLKADSKDILSEIVENFILKKGDFSYTINNLLSLKEASLPQELSLSTVFPSTDLYKIEFSNAKDFKSLHFILTQTEEDKISFSETQLGLKGSINLDESGKLHYSFYSNTSFRYRVTYKEEENKKSYHNVKKYIYYSNSLDSTDVGSSDKGDKKLKWFGLDFDYYIFTNVLPENSSFLYNINENGNFVLTSSTPSKSLEFYQIFTKKEYDHLINLGDKLELSVDFGIWSLLAVPMLRVLQFFYTLFPNWGIAIILLTLVMRTVTFPLQYKSYKSMKKMQIIQPELSKLREKYKKDPKQLQVETMALFKKAGANPLGGCLPMVLQMPIFFAFYQVLYNAVELVNAPFYGWITDLSDKDPYYILPGVMALSMFLQQRLTPMSITDPTQKKIMMFMPLIFGFIMKDLPAGLSLYIFVSTIFGMSQQLFVYKRVS